MTRAPRGSSARESAAARAGTLVGDRPPAPARGVRTGLLGLGSNVGDRLGHLQAAVHALAAAGVGVLRSSSVYDTDPVGEVPGQRSFLNACLAVRTALDPRELLDTVKALERELGREPGGVRHGPRTIDIDILLLGELRHADERMTLPHEQLLRRRFVLIPALELDFELATPDGHRLSDALAALPLDEGVRFAGPPLQLPAREGTRHAYAERSSSSV